jgi:MobA/VirD2-like, nuclease domain
MIPAVHPRGTNVGRLLHYLFGPGKREEHVNPRLVAAWDGAGSLAALQPPARGEGGHDVRRLAELLEQHVAAGWNPPAKTVWHCSIRNHPTDRTLSDAQWAHIAGEVMAAVGLAPHGDPDAVRWVAVRHNDDHIHLVATLVRQDQRTAWAWKDKLRIQRACRDLEERYGLYRVAAPGSGSRRWPRPAELNKAARLKQTDQRGRPQPPRERLRRRVREVAAIATSETEFFARLGHAGVQVKLRYSSRNPNQITGYAVTLPGHTTPDGRPIWYGGGRLAPDLTLPRLRTRWADTADPTAGPMGPARLAGLGFPASGVYQRAAHVAAQAATMIRDAPDAETASAIAAAAADLLTATAQAWEGRRGGPLTDAADQFDRAAYDLRRQRQRSRPPGRRVSHAVQLRAMARLIALMGAISHDRDTMAALHLLYTLAALAENLADLRDAQHRLHQARAARTAAAYLRAAAPPPAAPTASPAPGPSRVVPPPDAARQPQATDRHPQR